jgi:hypothetical protein
MHEGITPLSSNAPKPAQIEDGTVVDVDHVRGVIGIDVDKRGSRSSLPDRAGRK